MCIMLQVSDFAISRLISNRMGSLFYIYYFILNSKKDDSYYGDVFVASNSDVDRRLADVYKHSSVKVSSDIL